MMIPAHVLYGVDLKAKNLPGCLATTTVLITGYRIDLSDNEYILVKLERDT